jgi:hypothetical protein
MSLQSTALQRGLDRLKNMAKVDWRKWPCQEILELATRASREEQPS